MSYVGKESRIVAIIQAKTKIPKEDICDILRVLPEAMAEMIIEQSLPEKVKLHLGMINAHWQKPTAHRPEIVFTATKRFRETLTRLKTQRKTPLAQQLFDYLPNKALLNKRNTAKKP